MKIKNISIKPIAFGTITLLPGNTATVEDSTKEAVELYQSLGYVEVIEEKAAAKRTTSKKKEDATQTDTGETAGV